MRFLLVIFSVSFISGITNANVGFKKGNKIEISELRGNLTAICQGNWGGNSYSYHNCAAYTVSPASHDYFVHPAIDADNVKLTVMHEDGSTKTVKSQFNAEKGISKKAFNLAVWTLTQRPILEMGENKVLYSLEKNAKSIREGSFKATKEVVEIRNCKARTIYFYNNQDCENQAFACDRYFAQENNCKY